MRFGSVCSGIEAASVAFGPLGWEAAWLAEVDIAASAVLAHHYGASVPQFAPDFEDDPPAKVGSKTAAEKLAAWHKAAKRIAWGDRLTNWGDMTRLPGLVRSGAVEAPDMLCGGTPCQAFSVAGKREGLKDPRGGLTLSFVELADAIDEVRGTSGEPPCVILWENVFGVLSSKDNAFGCFLAALAGEDVPLEPPGGRWANAGVVLGPQRAVGWRIGDAQYFGVPQRRRRDYVVASARDGFDPARVLFESEGVRRDTPPSRETGAEVAGAITGSLGRRGGRPDGGDTKGQLVADRRPGCNVRVVSTLDASYARLQGTSGQDLNHGHSHLVVEDTCGTLGGTSPGGGWRFGADEAAAGQLVVEAFGTSSAGFGGACEVTIADTLRAKGGDTGNGGETIVVMSTGQTGAEIVEGGGCPTLTCNHEAPIVVHGPPAIRQGGGGLIT